MYFAGEATNELYNGFVHGAYFSGLERAEKMLQHIKANGNY
jgi:monoamine oxidase